MIRDAAARRQTLRTPLSSSKKVRILSLPVTAARFRNAAFESIAIDDKDHAFQYLQQAYSQHSIELTNLKVNPVYDPLRSDPRFQQLLARIHLADVPTHSAP